MDATAIALSLGMPCFFLSLVFAYIAYALELDVNNRKVDRALADERVADRLVTAMLAVRIGQCSSAMEQIDRKIQSHCKALEEGQQAVMEHQVMIAALNDLGKCSWRKRKRVHTLPYHRPITQSYLRAVDV